MYQDRILLTTKEILDKEFKIDTRGYRPQEVDKFLDVVIRDYEEFVQIIKEVEKQTPLILISRLQQTRLLLIKDLGVCTSIFLPKSKQGNLFWATELQEIKEWEEGFNINETLPQMKEDIDYLKEKPTTIKVY